MMKKMLPRNRVWSYFTGYTREGHGVTSLSFFRFLAVLFLYAGAFVVLATDPFFQDNGIFVYRQGIVTVFFAFVVTASLNWELLLFGRASGANMFLQILQIPPLTLLLARLTAFPSTPSHQPLIKKLFQFLQDTDKELFNLTSMVPDWLTDLFSNWRISLCFMLVLFILSFRNIRMKLALLISVLVILLGSAASSLSIWLIGGTVLLACGYSFQFCRYDRVIFFENAVRRIARSGTCDSMLTSVMLSVLTVFYESGKVSRPRLLQLVQSVYAGNRALNGDELQLLAGEIVRKMVYQYDLAEVIFTGEGEFLAPNPRLFSYDNLLGMVAVAPRIVMTLMFGVLWIFLPVDLVPDGIPFLGVLDDAAVALISCFAFQRALPVFRSSPREKVYSISQS